MKTKIIFGLTFRQLIYCLIFGSVALAILFKTPYDIYIRIALSLIPSSICAIFILTKLPSLAVDYVRWLFNKEYYLMDAKMKQWLNLKEINGSVVELYDKKLSIIKIEPINFSIKNKKEKEIIISSFQKFLNSLDFAVQIVVATDSINFDYYMNLLEKRVSDVAQKTGNKNYFELFEGYKKNLDETVSKNSLMNRSFYLVVPEDNKIGLSIQVDVCKQLLKNLDLRHELLEEEELTNTLSEFFNDLYQDDDKQDLLKQPLKEEEQLHYSVAPKCFINYKDYAKVGDKYARTIAVKGYPRIVEEGFLDKIITLNGDFDLSLHIEPFPIETMMINLNSELQKQRADLYAMKKKEIISPALEIQYKDTRNVLENLQKGNEKLFNLSLYITCKSDTLEGLNTLTKKAESELNSMLLMPLKPLFKAHEGVISGIPLASNKLGIRRNLTTNALSAFFPFTSQFLQIDETGVWLGLNKNNIPIIKDIFKLYNANGVILASSGGGKSYFTKLMISRLLLNGTKVMVIDPQSEYIDLVNKFDGELVTISRTSDSIINPLDLMGHDYDEKKLTLFDLFPIMLGQTSEIQKAVLDRALTAVYEAKGITKDNETWKREPPIMGDLLQQLVTMSRTATQVEKETYRSLINRIEMFVNGVFSFLNKQTNLNFENRFVCFNIGDMPNQVKPAIMFLILDYVYMKMKKDIERKILVIDEGWSLLERTEDESYIFRIVKTCRKFNLGLLLITQDVGDLLKNDAGKALLNNSEYTLLLRQKPSIIEQVEKTFQLSQKERERLLTATAGEGILIISNEHTEIKVVASPEEHKIITTNADERLEKEREKANEIVTEFEKTTLDYSKGIFKKANLTKEEIAELLKRGYVLSSHIGLYGGRREEYLLKPRFNESPEHLFVTKKIEKYLRRYTNKIELFETKEADIVFEINGKKAAIEIETGHKYSNDRKKLDFKVKQLRKKYGDNWFFVVTDWTFKEKYQKLGMAYVRKEVPAILKKQYFSQVSNSVISGSDDLENKHFEVQTSPLITGKNSETLNLEQTKEVSKIKDFRTSKSKLSEVN